MFEFLKRLFGRTPAAAAPPPEPRLPFEEPHPLEAINPTFEAAVGARPEDATAWQVYSDWLIDQGESWGEVIAAAQQGKPDTARQAAAERGLLGGMPAKVSWRGGVIEHFELHDSFDAFEKKLLMHVVLERVLKHPAGHFVRKLTLGLPCADSTEWHLEDLFKAISNAGPLPCLVELDLSQGAEHMDQPSWRRVGDARVLWKAAPNLKVLALQGAVGSDGGVPSMLAPIDAPHLEHLRFESGGLDRSVPLELGAASLPSLTHLELWFGQANYGANADVADLAGILDGAGLPALKTLGLKNSEWEGELIEAVAKSKLLPRLEVVDFSMGVLATESAAALLLHAARYQHLKRVDLSDNYFSAADQQALKQALPNVHLGEQKADEDPEYRYTSVGE
ncbi:MAG: TIGR02996 domain-containing protein [Archangium sp.]|nr:TIGR02996 domain-containing protein [Archangium sp.]